ncbi:MAG: hypothetical protein WBD36_04130 [Bacteroidota bacterium]
MKRTLVCLFASLLFVSCSNQGTTDPGNGQGKNPSEDVTAGVKTKITYPTLDSDQPMSIEDFEYDSLNRLHKRSFYGGDREILYEYDDYFYDGNGLLTKRLDYYSNVNSPSGFLLLILRAYIYSDGLLISEQDTFPQAVFSEEYKYEYSSGQLVSKSFYHNGNLENKTIYTYENGRLQNESKCNPTGKSVSLIEYSYQDNFLVESRLYGYNGDLMTKTSYDYNENGKLITENVQVIQIFSSYRPYVVRYQY